MKSVENLLYMRRDQNKTNHNSQPSTPNPQLSTLNPQLSTLNSQLSINLLICCLRKNL